MNGFTQQTAKATPRPFGAPARLSEARGEEIGTAAPTTTATAKEREMEATSTSINTAAAGMDAIKLKYGVAVFDAAEEYIARKTRKSHRACRGIVRCR